MPRIGPTFGQELLAAGCAEGVTWTPDGLISESNDAVEKVLAAHNPTKPIPRVLSKKALYQALDAASVLPAFIAALTSASVRDEARWASYDLIPSDNPVLSRICAAATIDVATLYGG